MAWFNQTDLKRTEIKELKHIPAKDGWVLIGFEADVFCWKSNPELQHLLIAMATWIDSGQGKAIEVVADSKAKAGYRIQLIKLKDKPVEAKWMLTGSGYQLAIDGEAMELNPFL